MWGGIKVCAILGIGYAYISPTKREGEAQPYLADPGSRRISKRILGNNARRQILQAQ